jgi:hypothetical protein
MICLACQQPVMDTDHGDWMTGRCPCGKTHWYRHKFKGALDLGLVRADPPEAKNDYEFFFEQFETIIDSGCEPL